MPIRRELRPLYPPNWPELSRQVRFERAGGVCQVCGRPHGTRVRCLPDGRWFDPRQNTWRDRRGRPARWPDLEDLIAMRTTLVVLAAAHLNHDPSRNGWRNLRSFCQRCHMLHDRSYHLAQRWITYRLQYAIGDLFLGLYQRGFAPRRAEDQRHHVSAADIHLTVPGSLARMMGRTGRPDTDRGKPFREIERGLQSLIL